MWDEVVRAAAADASVPADRVLHALDSLDLVYCQTWQYDDAPARLAAQLGIAPRRLNYSGIGGTQPQQLVNAAAEAILQGHTEVAVVASAEALDTQRRYRARGERYPYRFKPQDKRPFPYEAPFHPAEVAHEVFQAWLTFAIFDNARRASLGVGLEQYRRQAGEMFSRFTEIAAANPLAWHRTVRDVDDLVTARPDNRMVGYPYTKYLISVMDVDMAAAVVITSHEAADRLGVPADQRIYLRGWCYCTDPVYVAEHADLASSPAMRAASAEAFRVAGAGIDDVAHLDLYSCFPSSVNFARDALGIAANDARPLTVTGGLPYHGGAGSGYMTHSIAQMVRRLRTDPGALGLVTGVGMHMTKHVFGLYSARPGPVAMPEGAAAQSEAMRDASVAVVQDAAGAEATVAAYSVVHGRDGSPEWGLLVCDVPGGRAYARLAEPDALAEAETTELVGRSVRLSAETATGPAGEVRRHRAELVD